MSDQNYEVKINLAGNLKKSLDESGKSSKKFENAIDSAKKSLGDLTKAAFSLQGAIVAALAGFSVKKVIDAANKQEDAVNRLNSALAQTSSYSKEASDDLQRFAAEMERTTIYGDELVLQQLALAKAFGASNDQSKDILKASADLAAALGIDLQSATRNVAKTLGGYAGELGETIPALKSLTQEQLRNGEGIKLLAERYKGAAAAATNTFSGRVAQLENTFGSLLETIGELIIKNPAILKAIKEVDKAISELINAIKAGGLQKFFGETLSSVLRFADAFLSIINKIYSGWSFVVNMLKGITAKFFQGVVKSAQYAALAISKIPFVGEKFKDSFDNLEVLSKQFSDSASESFENAANSGASSFSDFIEETRKKLLQLEQDAKKPGEAISSGIKNADKAIPKTFTEMLAGLADGIESFWNDLDITGGLKEFFSDPIGNLKTFFKEANEGVGEFLTRLGNDEEFRNKISGAAGQAAGFLKQGAAGAAGALAAGADLIAPGLGQVVQLLSLSKDELKSAIRGFIDAIPEVISTIIENIPVLITELIAGIPRLIDAFASKIDVVIFAFVDGMIEAAPKIAAGIGKAIIRYIGSGGGIGSIFGFSQGGVTPNYGPSNKDIYPSMLSRGERVLTADQNNLFEKMLAVMEQNKNQTIEVKNGPMNLNANLMLDKRVLANVFLDISRSNMRTA